MEEFIEYILQFGNLNQQQTDLITKKATTQKLNKGAYFSEAGKISKRFGFLVEGVIRVCYYNNKGDEITKYFIEKESLIVDFESFDKEIESTAYVQAVTDCRIVYFTKKDWQELLQTIIGWDSIQYKMIAKAYMQKVDRRSPLVSQDATERYVKFLEVYPNMVNKIPLSYIASYLGITQSSLSRLRKNIE